MSIAPVHSDVTGKVWKVCVTAGTEVAQDDILLIVESMKMEIPIVAPCVGRVHAIEVAEGDGVNEGQSVASIAS